MGEEIYETAERPSGIGLEEIG
jgi:hypothetical protein